ncbi:NmrA family NAD(P)-binding protein [Pedobacter caeni]|uniref:Uncharacterized conserved protein YbjT, contains NAD(P)-binding and DUF2867 domains n=1 Tax=Pedobacter caeni TaxID=288992 RepID=A0A1M5GML7_9SPHI|nr:NmrA family NAD(P)-binding protein [Pedobacter caeni]SHG04985.1 Uncharacterized conserved protein YbjT, contains NAD(P)-binding and DUF2867 domains [Pedobacter caeni]
MEQTNTAPRILVLGASGLTGKAVVQALKTRKETFSIVLASRKKEQVKQWHDEGEHAVYIDLNDARTFPVALKGITRIYLLTGYTVEMIHQSKTLVDAAVDAGVDFIVHLGIFGNGKMTNPHFAWHEMIDSYIKASGIKWSILHPNTFYSQIPVFAPIINGVMQSFIGDKKTGFVAVKDIAEVAALVLAEGPEKHADKHYFLSTENVNIADAAHLLSEVTEKQISYLAHTPADLFAAIESGQFVLPEDREKTYSDSGLGLLQEVYDGRLDSLAVTTNTVSDLLGRPAISLKDWMKENLSLFNLTI